MERDRDRETETERDRDRETETQTERQRERDRDTETQRHRDRQRQTETERRRNKYSIAMSNRCPVPKNPHVASVHIKYHKRRNRCTIITSRLKCIRRSQPIDTNTTELSEDWTGVLRLSLTQY